jgi:hypothetical protein
MTTLKQIYKEKFKDSRIEDEMNIYSEDVFDVIKEWLTQIRDNYAKDNDQDGKIIVEELLEKLEREK